MRFALDHVMIEVDEPEAACGAFNEVFGLPGAWPLQEGPDYDSVGLNFGVFNVEFIRFRLRFGIPVQRQRNAVGGVAFKVEGTLEEARRFLAKQGIGHETGEVSKGHTTIVLDRFRHAVTPFLVQYHFDTSGWISRLRQEFREAGGGRFGLAPDATLLLGSGFRPYKGILAGISCKGAGTLPVVRVHARSVHIPKELEMFGIRFEAS